MFVVVVVGVVVILLKSHMPTIISKSSVGLKRLRQDPPWSSGASCRWSNCCSISVCTQAPRELLANEGGCVSVAGESSGQGAWHNAHQQLSVCLARRFCDVTEEQWYAAFYVCSGGVLFVGELSWVDCEPPFFPPSQKIFRTSKVASEINVLRTLFLKEALPNTILRWQT
jgi:hypothetical protein